MPNWVFNHLTITGEDAEVKRLKERVGKPFSMLMDKSKWNEEKQEWDRTPEVITYENPIFSFMNITAPEDKEAYAKQPARSGIDLSDPKWWEKTQEWSATQHDWYNWNNTNWGTKWDVANHGDDGATEIRVDEPGKIAYGFDTAWAPPVEAMEALARLFPTLTLTLEWEEEQGFGGTIVFKNEDTTEIESYDSKCKDCDALDTMAYCEDCEDNICSKCSALGEVMVNDDCPKHGKVAVK